jgi:ATP-dependent DNA ligase
VDQLKDKWIKSGDLGVTAEQSRSTQRTMFAPAKLTVDSVFNTFRQIAALYVSTIARSNGMRSHSSGWPFGRLDGLQIGESEW